MTQLLYLLEGSCIAPNVKIKNGIKERESVSAKIIKNNFAPVIIPYSISSRQISIHPNKLSMLKNYMGILIWIFRKPFRYTTDGCFPQQTIFWSVLPLNHSFVIITIAFLPSLSYLSKTRQVVIMSRIYRQNPWL